MPASPREHSRNRLITLLITALSSFLIPFMSSSVIIALPAMGREFEMNVISLAWVTSAYLLASAALLVPFGRLSDIYGRKGVFLAGYIVFFFGSSLAAAAPGTSLLLASRVIQGIGGAAIFSTSLALLTAAFAPAGLGRALGINTASVYVGLSMGPFFGGLLTEFIGWRSIFWLSSLSSLMVIAAVVWKLREVGEMKKERFDLAGTVLYSTTLTTLIYGLSRLPDTVGILSITAGILLGGLFVRRENRMAAPLIQFRIFIHNRGFTFSSLAALVHYSGTWAVAFLLSLFLQYARELPAETAGLILITSPVVQALLSPFCGRLSDRVEPRILASIGMAVTVAGMVMLALLTAQTGLVYIIACLVIIGVGFAFFSSPNTNAIMSSIDPAYYGFASATVATMRQIGMTLSMGMVMVVFALVIGNVEITPDRYPAFITSTRIIFLVAAMLCFGAIFASLARGNIHRRPRD